MIRISSVKTGNLRPIGYSMRISNSGPVGCYLGQSLLGPGADQGLNRVLFQVAWLNAVTRRPASFAVLPLHVVLRRWISMIPHSWTVDCDPSAVTIFPAATLARTADNLRRYGAEAFRRSTTGMLAHYRWRNGLRDALRLADIPPLAKALGVCADDRRTNQAGGASHREEKTNGRVHVANPFDCSRGCLPPQSFVVRDWG
jgi:hypothetical protein